MATAHQLVRRFLVLVVCAIALATPVARLPLGAAPKPSFASLVARLSEPGGDFDTDNLISNERSYLNVIPALRHRGVRGGAYIGVGPDQNFSYIAQVRPAIAFIIDVRRDNLLLHLLFKALFASADSRVEYLSLLTGRPAPAPAEEWKAASIEKMAGYIDGTKATAESIASTRARADRLITRFGVPLALEDLQTIDRFHRKFIDAGLSLRFQTIGRAPQPYYPTYRDLLLGGDQDGRSWNYLASEDDFRFVQSLEARDLVIPVVGDLAGSRALAEIGRVMAERGDVLSAFYASNVEMYLFRDGSFPRFVDNLGRLPRDERSVVIRSIFRGGYGFALPGARPGDASASVVQSANQLVTEFSSGKYRSYTDIVARSALQ